MQDDQKAPSQKSALIATSAYSIYWCLSSKKQTPELLFKFSEDQSI